MHSIDLIKKNLKRSEDFVLSRIEDMREHCLVFSTSRGGCHTLWVLGHVAYIESLVIQSFMLGKPNPLADFEKTFDGDEVSGEAADYPSFDRTLKVCRESRASTISLLDSLVEDDLNKLAQKAPEGAEELFGDYRSCFQYVSDHWFMHRGQLADARCMAGVGRMWY